MRPEDKEPLFVVSFRFVSWPRNHFPDLKDRILEKTSFFASSYGELIRGTPTSFWGYVGD